MRISHDQFETSQLLTKTLVLTLFAIMTAVFVYEMSRFARNIPRNDDYYFLRDMLTYRDMPALSWFWRQEAEHRFPLGKVLQWTFYLLGRGDLRVGMFGGFSLFAVAVFAILLLIWRYRGRAIFEDVVIPMALLHTGHLPYFLFFFIASKAATTILPVLILLNLSSYSKKSPCMKMISVLLCVLIPLCDSTGVIITPFVIICLAMLGHHELTHDRRLNWAMLASMALMCGLMVLYLVGHRGASYTTPDSFSVAVFIKKWALFLSGMFGEAVWKLRPLSLFLGPLTVVLALYISARYMWRQQLEVYPVVGALLGMVSIAAAVAILRNTEGMPNYYYLTSAIVIVPVYVLVSSLHDSMLWRMLGRVLMVIVAAGLLWHGAEGRRMAREAAEACDLFAVDCRRSEPIVALVAKHRFMLACPSELEESWAEFLANLRSSGREPFSRISTRDRLTVVDPEEFEMVGYNCAERKHVLKGKGQEAGLVFTFDGPRYISAVQFIVQTDEPCDGSAEVFCLVDEGGSDFPLVGLPKTRWVYNSLKKPFPRRQTIWIDRRVMKLFIRVVVSNGEWSISSVKVLTMDPGVAQEGRLRNGYQSDVRYTCSRSSR